MGSGLLPDCFGRERLNEVEIGFEAAIFEFWFNLGLNPIIISCESGDGKAVIDGLFQSSAHY